MATISTEAKRRTSTHTATNGPVRDRHPADRRGARTDQPGEAAPQWPAWCRQLAERAHRPVARLLTTQGSPLAWHVSSDLLSVPTAELIAALAAGPHRKGAFDVESAAESWLAAAASDSGHVAFALACLAWCDALPSLAPLLSERSWWTVLNTLVAIAKHDDPAVDDPLACLLLGGELPLCLAYTLPELDACRALAAPGAARVVKSLDELTDDGGILHAEHLPLVRPLVASWTRCLAIGSEEKASWHTIVRPRYALALRHAFQLSRSGGEQMLAASSGQWSPELVRTALRLADDATTRRAWRLATEGQLKKNARRVKDLPPAFHSESSALAMLRTDWTRSSPRLCVTYSGREVQLELSLGKQCVISGPWEYEVRVDGQIVGPRADWEHACWESDHEVDYLELEQRLEGGVRVERHILLCRDSPFAFLADAVLGVSGARVEYRSRLPLSDGASYRPERETNEGMLHGGGKPRARVLPLALAEWRASSKRGELSQCGRWLELTQAAHGRGLFAPLFLDVDGRRVGKEATWRQLTVAEERTVVPSDEAVGYRVQADKSQWIIYRSLVPSGVRTLLSASTSHEFLVGDFHDDGSVHRLLEIAPE